MNRLSRQLLSLLSSLSFWVEKRSEFEVKSLEGLKAGFCLTEVVDWVAQPSNRVSSWPWVSAWRDLSFGDEKRSVWLSASRLSRELMLSC